MSRISRAALRALPLLTLAAAPLAAQAPAAPAPSHAPTAAAPAAPPAPSGTAARATAPAAAPAARAAGTPAAPAAPAAPQPSAAHRAGADQGTTAAEAFGTTKWTLTGFASGLFLGPVGAGLAWTLARSGDSAPPAAVATKLDKQDPEYRIGYQRAYSERLTAKRTFSALAGGVAGTALFTTASAVLLLR